MPPKGTMRVALLAVAAAASAAFGFPPPSRLACPVGTALRRGGEFAGMSHELYCARADGTKHGPSRKFSSGWRTEGSFANGREVGVWRTWHPNGSIFSRHRLGPGGIDGPEITWNADGTVASKGEYRRGDREGPWMVSDEDVTGRGNYRHGARQGRWVFSSKGHLVAAGDYRDGEFEGPWVFYWQGGGLESRGRFRHGLKQGRWRYFEPEGWLRVVIQCRDGEADGNFLGFDKHRRIEMRGFFENGTGGVKRVDGSRPWGLCGDDCWARDHCDTEDLYTVADD